MSNPSELNLPSVSRARFAAGAAAATFASIGIIARPAKAAQFEYKFATNAPNDNPLTARGIALWDAVRRDTNGRLDVKAFPNNTLGGDTQMLTQLRSNAIQFFPLSGGILINVVQVSGIQGVPFAFRDEAHVYQAMDGDLGAYIRKEIDAIGLFAFPKILDNGFRQITSSTHPIRSVNDLSGFKIRTPAGKLWVDLFKTLGASPTTINISEAYTAMQTHVVDGQENPYIVIEFNKFYEVQKYLSVTNHMWDGFWLLANKQAWNALPSDIQAIVLRHASTTYADQERSDVAKLNNSLAEKLRSQGFAFNTADTSGFRAKLASSGFYGRWRDTFGAQAWTLLEKYAGKLG
jgi:TRAP-type transport system periplasmic protein